MSGYRFRIQKEGELYRLTGSVVPTNWHTLGYNTSYEEALAEAVEHVLKFGGTLEDLTEEGKSCTNT